MESVATTPEHLPILDQRFVLDFINEWNTLYEKLGGASHDNLIELAKKTKINQAAATMLTAPNIKSQLIGIITLGNMRSEGAWPFLVNMAKNSETTLSMAAYRALSQIDVNKALVDLLPQLISRTDWPPSMVAKILKDVKNPKVCRLLEDVSYKAKDNELPNIIRYINVLKCPNSTKLFRQILDRHVDDQMISLCLHELNDPSAIDLVYRYIDYPRWHVRVNVAHALGKIGGKEDVEHLIKLLSDRQWWVRYRAAEALVNLPFINSDEIRNIKNTLEDEKARQIMEQAMAEKEMA
jgi:HEAT repeat protein